MKKPVHQFSFLSIPVVLAVSASAAFAGNAPPPPPAGGGLFGKAETVVQDAANVVVTTIKAPFLITQGLMGTVCPACKGPSVVESVTDMTGSVGNLGVSSTDLATAPVDMVSDAMETHGGTPGKVAAAPQRLLTRTLKQIAGLLNTVLHLGKNEGGGSVTVEAAAVPYKSAPANEPIVVQPTKRSAKERFKMRRRAWRK